MILIVMTVLAYAIAAPTLGRVENLKPNAAGKLILRNRLHAPISSAGRAVAASIGVPGVTNYELVETPQRIAGGCVRRRWTAHFSGRHGAPEATRVLTNVTEREEVALAAGGICPAKQYAILNGAINQRHAIALLEKLRRISTGRVRPRIDCRSDVDLLCASPNATRAGIAAIPAWAVMQSGEEGEIWLGERGKVVTIVKMSRDNPDKVTVTREIPPPF